jgi:acetate CoA-transferase
MSFRPQISADLKEMHSRLFFADDMGIKKDWEQMEV